jgi:hypothetical protein
VAFEFGTLGESLLALYKSLRAILWENQLHHHGAAREDMVEKLRGEFTALYAPRGPSWQKKAIADTRLALQGILQAEGFFSS